MRTAVFSLLWYSIAFSVIFFFFLLSFPLLYSISGSVVLGDHFWTYVIQCALLSFLAVFPLFFLSVFFNVFCDSFLATLEEAEQQEVQQ